MIYFVLEIAMRKQLANKLVNKYLLFNDKFNKKVKIQFYFSKSVKCYIIVWMVLKSVSRVSLVV